MQKMITLLAVSLFLAPLIGCGPGPAGVHQSALNAIGSGCTYDTDCASGLCFDTADAYPLYNPSWEQGYVCTVECSGGTAGDTYCRNLAAQYNAPRPQNARCIFARAVYDDGPDEGYYICDLIAAGLGDYWSE